MARLQKNQREIVGFDGVKRIYTFDELTVADAADVEHELWSIVARIGGNLGESAGPLLAQVGSGGLQPSDYGAIAQIPASVLQAIPRDELKALAKAFLSGTIVDGGDGKATLELVDGWNDEYFRGRWPERIDAIMYAIDVSFPGYFSLALAYLKDFVGRRLGIRISSKDTDTGSRTE